MKTMQYDIGLTFGIEAAVGQFITGYEPGSQYVPSAEENYRFRIEIDPFFASAAC